MFGNCLEQLSNIYDSVDSIMITNREGIIEYTAVIDAGKCSIGNEGYTGRHLLEVYPDLTEAESTMFRVMKTGQPIVDEIQTVTDWNGMTMTISCSTYPIELGNKIIGAVLDSFNYELMFHKITLRSGYYTGVQFYVEVEHDLTEDKDYTNDDCHYYFDCCRSVAYRKYEAEIRKINRKLAVLGKEYGFQEYVCTARFSNGEAWYDLASNSRARLKSVVA